MDEHTLLYNNMSCGLRKIAFCIRQRSVEGGVVTVQLLVEWVTRDPEPPPQFFNVLLCNLSSYCPIFN